MFSVCRCDVTELSEDEVKEQAKKDAFDDRAGTLLYIKEGFNQCVLEGDYKNAVQIYAVSDDERWGLFETEITEALSQMHGLGESAGKDSSQVLKILNSIEESMQQKKVTQLRGKEDLALTDSQINQKSCIGYAFAIITLGFLFCGVYVAHTVIEEQNNKVYTRVMLSKASRQEILQGKHNLQQTVFVKKATRRENWILSRLWQRDFPTRKLQKNCLSVKEQSKIM